MLIEFEVVVAGATSAEVEKELNETTKAIMKFAEHRKSWECIAEDIEPVSDHITGVRRMIVDYEG